MGCRIGITTDLEQRKKDWESKYEGFSDWQKLAGPLSRKEAQEKETELAEKYGCEASPGGDYPDSGDEWYVYYFKFTEEK